jgi:hypothetical protein
MLIADDRIAGDMLIAYRIADDRIADDMLIADLLPSYHRVYYQ